MKSTNSFLTIGWQDLLKGFILAAISAVLTGVYTSVTNGTFPPDLEGWKSIGIVGLGAGIAYILKNWLTNSDDKFLSRETGNIGKSWFPGKARPKIDGNLAALIPFNTGENAWNVTKDLGDKVELNNYTAMPIEKQYLELMP